MFMLSHSTSKKSLRLKKIHVIIILENVKRFILFWFEQNYYTLMVLLLTLSLLYCPTLCHFRGFGKLYTPHIKLLS